MNIIALYLREIRGWRHRFWWLPLAGLIGVLLPLSLLPPKTRDLAANSWEEQAYPSFLWPPVPQQSLALVILTTRDKSVHAL